MKNGIFAICLLTLALAGCGGGGSSSSGGSTTPTSPITPPIVPPVTPPITPPTIPPITPPVTPVGTPYYVAPTGSDSNPGTLALPWKTLQKAVSTVGPGSVINARAGTYTEQVIFTTANSGSASGGYITLQNYPGEKAIIDGTSIVLSANSANMALVNLTDVSYVRVIGFEICNLTTNSAAIVPAGIFVSGSGSNIELRNNYVHNIVTTVNSASGNAFGIGIYGTEAPASINGLILDGNEVAFLKTGSSESVSVNGNVENFQVTNNVVHDNDNIGIDFIGFEGTSPNPAYDQARNGEVSGNVVYNISSYVNSAYPSGSYGADGLYVDGGTNIVMERNIVYQTDIGIEVASEHAGHLGSFVTLRSNLIYKNNLTGISLGGTSATANGGTDSCGIFNNTLYQNDTTGSGTGEIALQNHLTNIQFANNVVISSTQGIFISGVSSALPAMNGDLYFSGGATGTWQWKGATYNSLAAFTTASGNEKNGLAADPVLISPTAGNFKLGAGSPAINAGIALTATQVGSLDLAGNPRVQSTGIDIGAYEH
ncbi:choice-of-anchor Q domain-containing protein [Solimicrobium silvestre]|uniref:DUF1565 domain-containing protein n=1 Tax=Solimicrobium silvestre TaxID=2099400 RepID=A0A2S9H559_9BURK|nr:choice-of-anchor Q domain-containing protein [Solimicrobium silvestre]PRC95125.1 hypothetical protein S2091_0320 [Solimicrobium silvestre]